MKIHIKDTDITLQYTMRTYIIYENLMNESLSIQSMQSYTSLIVLFYAAVIASIQKAKLDVSISYDEFFDFLDTNQGEILIRDFSNWFAEHLTNNIAIQDTEDSDNDNSEDTVDTSKKG